MLNSELEDQQVTPRFYPPASEASRGVYRNQAQKNFTHLYTEYPWVSVTLSLCNSVANNQVLLLQHFHYIDGGQKKCPPKEGQQ